MTRPRRLLAVPFALAASLMLSASALAVPPEHHVTAIDETYQIPAEVCGFPIEGHVQVTFRDTVFVDEYGQPSRIVNVPVGFVETWTNLDSGASTYTRHTGASRITFYPEGTLVAVSGLSGHLKSPDGGFIQADIGHRVIWEPVDGPPELLSVAGQNEGGPFPGLCDILAG